MGDTSETNTKVLYRELFLGVVTLKTPIPQNHYLRDKVPFLKSGHIYVCVNVGLFVCMYINNNSVDISYSVERSETPPPLII